MSISTSQFIHWPAKITGTLILALLLFFLLAHLFGNDESGQGFTSTEEVLTFMCFPISTIVGLGLAYKWPGLGGLITLVGLAGLFVLRSDLLDNVYMWSSVVPGALYVGTWAVQKRGDSSLRSE